jgi:hypothetical protein
MEYRIALDFPVVPLEGEEVHVPGRANPALVGKEFWRFRVGEPDFAITTADAEYFEVVPAEAFERGTRHSWSAVRSLAQAEWASRSSSPTR